MQRASQEKLALQYEEMLADGQKVLADFLRAEVAIGSTFLKSAELAAGANHLDHANDAKKNARKAAGAVRQFLGQVTDRAAKSEIGEGLAKLEKDIAAL